MPRSYLYHQVDTSHAAWRHNSGLISTVAEEHPAEGQVEVPQRADPQPPAAAAAYWITQPQIEEDAAEELPEGQVQVFGHFTFQVLTMSMGGSGQGPDGIPPGTGHWTVHARGPQRADNTAYLINESFVVDDLPEDPPEGVQEYPDRADGSARASLEAYWFGTMETFQIRDEVPPGRGFVTEIAPGAPHAALEAYWFDSWLSPQIPDGVPPGRGWWDEIARGPERASLEAYSFLVMETSQIPDEVPPGRGWVTEFATGPQRTSNDQYWLDNLLAVEEVPDAEMPPGLGHITFEAPGPFTVLLSYGETRELPELDTPQGYVSLALDAGPPLRADETAYVVTESFVIDDAPAPEPHEGELLLPERADGFPRAANTAYQIDISPQIPDEVPPGRGSVTERADGAARAANTAYFINELVQIDAAPLPEGELELPERADGAARTANTAYWITQPQIANDVVESDLPPGLGFVTQTLFELAYPTLTLGGSGQVPDEVPPGRGWQPDKADGPLRAANDVYFVHATVPPEEAVAEEPPAGRGHETLRAAGPRRAANTAYFISLTGLDELLPPALGHITDRADGPDRTANTAYWIRQPQIADNIVADDMPPARGHIAGSTIHEHPQLSITLGGSGQAPDEVPEGRGHITDVAEGPPRAGNVAYTLGLATIPPEEPAAEEPPPGRGAFTDVAEGPPRAGNVAYHIGLQPAVPELEEPPEGRIVWPTQRDELPRAAESAYWIPPYHDQTAAPVVAPINRHRLRVDPVVEHHRRPSNSGEHRLRVDPEITKRRRAHEQGDKHDNL
jgi:hypothetical protein